MARSIGCSATFKYRDNPAEQKAYFEHLAGCKFLKCKKQGCSQTGVSTGRCPIHAVCTTCQQKGHLAYMCDILKGAPQAAARRVTFNMMPGTDPTGGMMLEDVENIKKEPGYHSHDVIDLSQEEIIIKEECE